MAWTSRDVDSCSCSNDSSPASSFGYDELGRLVTVTDALGQMTSHAYDEVGNRLSQTDANGHTTRFEYDRLGRETTRELPDGAREAMSYDVAGNLAAATDLMGWTSRSMPRSREP